MGRVKRTSPPKGFSTLQNGTDRTQAPTPCVWGAFGFLLGEGWPKCFLSWVCFELSELILIFYLFSPNPFADGIGGRKSNGGFWSCLPQTLVRPPEVERAWLLQWKGGGDKCKCHKEVTSKYFSEYHRPAVTGFGRVSMLGQKGVSNEKRGVISCRKKIRFASS